MTHNFSMSLERRKVAFRILIMRSKTPLQQNVAEMELLQNLVKSYKQRKLNLERKLLELNSMKEEKSILARLRRKIDEKTSKLNWLNITIYSLQEANKVLQEKLKENVLAEKQLEIAKKIVNEMQRKKDVNESPAKKQILILQQQVNEFQKYESSRRNDMVNKKLKALENLELEVLALKRANKELELEKREVRIKLATAEEIIKKKEKMEAEIRKEMTGLRHVSEELSKQFDRLQRNRFDMVQELVYQRWLYICMRFEAIQQQKRSRKASGDDFIHNSEKSLCKEIEASTSDPELDSISSSNNTFDESDEIDTTTTPESSSSSQSSSSKTTREINKQNYSSKSSASPITSRLKRVSFNDSIKPSIYVYMPDSSSSSCFDPSDDNETMADIGSSQDMELTSSTSCYNEVEAEQYEKPSSSDECAGDDHSNNDTTIPESKGSMVELSSNNAFTDSKGSTIDLSCNNAFARNDNIKVQEGQLVAFFFFLLIAIAYFLVK